MSEIQEAAEVITGAVSPDANIIFGASIRPELEDEIIVTVVATGFDSDYYNEPAASEQPVEDVKNETPSAAPKDFALESKSNMWESIKNEPTPEPEPAPEDDDMDVPPSLRERFKKRRK
jgi:cell division protein FtsZ